MRSSILALHNFLREVDLHQQRLGLKRLPTYTSDHLWFCDTHYQAAQPKIPDRICLNISNQTPATTQAPGP